MSAEDNMDSPPQRTLDPVRKGIIDLDFSSGKKLYHDIFSVWAVLVFFNTPESIETLVALQHYRQYMEENNFSLEEIDYIMSLSDPEDVTAFDQLIDEFNADLERIKTTRDTSAIKIFHAKAKQLFSAKK